MSVAAGVQVYSGPTAGAMDHFAQLGYPCPGKALNCQIAVSIMGLCLTLMNIGATNRWCLCSFEFTLLSTILMSVLQG